MHRSIRDDLEEALEGKQNAHLENCEPCRREVAEMREQAQALRTLRAEADPGPGFYARVVDRIEAQRAVSIWSVLAESPFGRRVAVVSMALALLLGGYLVTSEEFPGTRTTAIAQSTQKTFDDSNLDEPVLTMPAARVPDRDAVLANLVTYRGQ
ncbi:MAG: anti-sigma factor family protein [Bryobacteraceae bacterium]